MPCISLAAHFNKWQGFSFAAQQSERKKKTSLHVPCEAVRNALTETRREVSALRFPLQGVVSRNFSRFTGRLLCSIANCLSARTGGSADFSPPYRFTVLLAHPFHFSFTIKTLNGQAVRCCMYRKTCEARLSVTSAVLGLSSFL